MLHYAIPGFCRLVFCPEDGSRCLCYMRDSPKFAVHGPDRKASTWDMWPQSFILMARMFRSDAPWYGSPHMNCSYKILGGEDGLLLVEMDVNAHESLYLVNPVTRSFRKLPGYCTMLEFSIFGMVWDENSKSHKIFATSYKSLEGEEECYHGAEFSDSDHESDMACQHITQVFVYDSEVNSWKLSGEWKGRVRYFDVPTFHQGIFYCLSTIYEEERPVRELYCFDGQKWWQEKKLAPVPRGLHFAHMFKWQGNFTLVGGKGKGREESQLSSIHVWELNAEGNRWVLTMSMPDRLVQGFWGLDSILHKNYRCHSAAGFFCLIGYSENVKPRIRQITCDLSTNSWWEAPELRYNGILYSRRGSHASSFLLNPNFEFSF